MSVLVLVEHTDGNIKKKSFEAAQYAAEIAKKTNTTATALVLGTIADSELENLGTYGVQKVLHVTDERLNELHARAYASALIAAAQKEGSKIIIALHDINGKAVAPRVAVKLKAGLVSGALSYPDLDKGFVLKKAVFSGKAFAFVNIISDVKVITVVANSFPLVAGSGKASIEKLDVTFGDKDFGIKVKSINKVTGEV